MAKAPALNQQDVIDWIKEQARQNGGSITYTELIARDPDGERRAGISQAMLKRRVKTTYSLDITPPDSVIFAD